PLAVGDGVLGAVQREDARAWERPRPKADTEVDGLEGGVVRIADGHLVDDVDVRGIAHRDRRRVDDGDVEPPAGPRGQHGRRQAHYETGGEYCRDAHDD